MRSEKIISDGFSKCKELYYWEVEGTVAHAFIICCICFASIRRQVSPEITHEKIHEWLKASAPWLISGPLMLMLSCCCKGRRADDEGSWTLLQDS